MHSASLRKHLEIIDQMFRWRNGLVFIIIVGLSFTVSHKLFAQEVTQKILKNTRILFLLDGSASMFGEWENTLKIQAARGILNELVDSLRINKDLELALRIYGHQFSVEEKNCEDTRLEVPFGDNNHDLIIERIKTLQPKGTTPIAWSLLQAANDFPSSGGYRNIVIIITDGVESCDGDPCEVSIELQKKGVFLKPFVIGLNLEQDYEGDFGCTGTYFDARKINDFRKALNLALNQSLSKTTVTVELLDDKNLPTETNINISFRNHLTGKSEYEFVHFRDKNGLTDTIEIEPVITYDIIANTIPPVVKSTVNLTGGIHNVIELKTPQGFLKIELPNSSRYEYGVEVLLRKNTKTEILHVQNILETGKYLAGKYDIEVLTIPETIFKNVEINYRETLTLTLAAPGLLNLVSPSYIYATMYQVDSDGFEKWVINLDTKNTTTKLAMQAGSYKIAYRSKNTFGSKYTDIKYFKIKSKVSTIVKLFD